MRSSSSSTTASWSLGSQTVTNMAFLLALISASLCLTSTAHDLDCLKPGAMTPHETDCEAFYICGEALKKHLFKCLVGESFNPVKKICDTSENVKCSRLDEKGADTALFNIKELLDKLPDILSGTGGEHHHTPENVDPRPDDEHKGEKLSEQEVVNDEEGLKQIEKRNTDEESLEMKPAEGEGPNDNPELKAETKIEDRLESMHKEEASDNHEHENKQKGNKETQETEMAEKTHSHEEESGETMDHDKEEKEEEPVQTHDIVSPDAYSGEGRVMLPFGSIAILKRYEDESHESFQNEKEEGQEKDGIESLGNEKEDGEHDEVEGLKEEHTEHEDSDKVNHDDLERLNHKDKENDEEKIGQVEAEVKDVDINDDEVNVEDAIEGVTAEINVDGIKDDGHEVNKENEEEEMGKKKQN